MRTVEDFNQMNPGKVWRKYCYDLDKGADIAKYIARYHYSWPGGYEMFAITDDGGTLCYCCCRTEFGLIARAIQGDGWNVVAFESTSNLDEPEMCSHCSKVIAA